MRIGLIGAGRIGTLHAGVLSAIDAVDELVIVDVEADRAKTLAEKLGVSHLDRPHDVFDEVDAVVIASSTETHSPYLIEAAAAGVPAFCEKPISIDLESTDRAVAAVHESGIPVQMGFMRRFDPGYVSARQAVAEGVVGDLLLVVAQTHDLEPPPEDYIAISGGIFTDMLIHEFDIIRFVTGSEFVDVAVTGTTNAMPVFGRYDDFGTVVVAAHLANGALAMIAGVRIDAIGYDVRMEVFGTADSVAVGLDTHTPIRTLEPGLDLPRSPATVGWTDRFGFAYRAEMEAFVRLVADGAASPCTVDDARTALVVADACRKAATEQRPVRIEEIG
ncbi:MAG: Gfo/Idh/MocA family oxidoreductase [Acidobacteria bacterium]|nr:Gfo/Idh/MocA family oxidoreductase [Acidobacteriota bacterium]